MSLCSASASCLHCDVTIASTVFVHRGQHHLIPFSKGTIKSLYSILLSFYLWPWMFIVFHSSFEQGNVACYAKEKHSSSYGQLRLPSHLLSGNGFLNFSTKNLWSICSCIASSKSLCVLRSPSISRLIPKEAGNLGRSSTLRNVLHLFTYDKLSFKNG